MQRGSCVKRGEGQVGTARPQAERWTTEPMTMWGICSVFETQSVFRTGCFIHGR